MKVKIIQTGEMKEFHDSYALRLIEQGKAVPVQSASEVIALKYRILLDNHRIFMNQDHFAETHTWNGVPFVCVPDDNEAMKRKNNNVVDIGWDGNTIDKQTCSLAA